mgnify:CR=1 FL=1
MKALTLIFTITLSCMLVPDQALSHSGNTDEYGCHSGKKPAKKEILDFISKHVAKWQVPDDVIYMDEIPHTATGKISKVDLRQQLLDIGYAHPDT